jgi:hypothetical protein
MHRCEVKMRYDLDTDNDSLVACGDIAIRKMGLIWVCHYHWKTFRVAIDKGAAENCRMAFDSTGCEEADHDAYFVTPRDPESI